MKRSGPRSPGVKVFETAQNRAAGTSHQDDSQAQLKPFRKTRITGKLNPQSHKNMKDSTHDKIEGTAKEAKGNIKESTGKIAGNERLKAEGRADKAEGRVQKKVGEIEKVFDR